MEILRILVLIVLTSVVPFFLETGTRIYVLFIFEENQISTENDIVVKP